MIIARGPPINALRKLIEARREEINLE